MCVECRLLLKRKMVDQTSILPLLAFWVKCSADLFVLQVIPMRRINWIFRVRLLPVLLLCAIRYVWLHADIFLLWLHGLHLLCILLDAWDGGLPCGLVLCPPHIQIYQVWVNCCWKMKSSRVVPVFGAHWEVSNIEKVSSRVQQEQLEIAMFQIRPLFIGTGNEPINLFCFCDCRDKNCLFLRPMYYLLATSDITITLLERWHAWISVEYPCYVVIYIFSKAYNNRSVETMPEAGSFVPCIIFFLVHCGVLELYSTPVAYLHYYFQRCFLRRWLWIKHPIRL